MSLPLPPQTDYGDLKEIPFAHAQVTAGLAAKLWPALQRARIEGAVFPRAAWFDT